MANSANVKNNTIVVAHPVNCFSQDGKTIGELAVKINFGRNIGMMDMDFESSRIHGPRHAVVEIEGDQMSFNANCMAEVPTTKRVTASVPPKFLDASHKATRSGHLAAQLEGRGMNKC